MAENVEMPGSAEQARWGWGVARSARRPPIPPVLLSGPPHTVTLEPSSLDIQVRVGRPGVRGSAPSPCVLVLTRAADHETDQLSLRLAGAGVPVVRFDADRCAGERFSLDASGGTLLWADGAYAPRVVWVRYFDPASVAAQDDPVVDAYTRRQWAAFASAMRASRGALNSAGTPNRLEQLDAARDAGLIVPRTALTTRPSAAAALLPGDGDVIVKTLGEHAVEHVPGTLHGLGARRIARAALPEGDEPAPVLVQPYIEATRELRVFWVAGRLIAFAVQSPSSAWNEPDDVEVSPADVTADVARPLRVLAVRFGLDVAAFDLLDTPSGPVFLEVNEACSWLFYERRAGVAPVSAAVLELIERRMSCA